MDFNDKPDARTINDVKGYYQNLWSPIHARFDLLDRYLRREFPVWSSENSHRPVYRPSTAARIVKGAADTQMAFVANVHRDPIDDSSKSLQDADGVEDSLNAILQDSASYEAVHPWKMADKLIIHLDQVIIEGPILDLSSKPVAPTASDYPDPDDLRQADKIHKAEKRNWNPIRIKVPHPSAVLLDPEAKDPPFAIKTGTMPAWKLHALTKRKKNPARGVSRRNVDVFTYDEKDQHQMINVTEWWSRRWYALKVDKGDVLFVEKNLSGFVPFALAFAGFGMVYRQNQVEGFPYSPEGILWDVLDSVQKESQQKTAKHELLIQSAFRHIVTEKDASTLAQEMANSDIIGDTDPNSIGFLDAKDVPGNLLRAGMEIDTDIEAGTYSKALTGNRQTGVDTVGQQAILSDAAERKFAAPLLQMDDLASIIGSRILRLVDIVPDLKGGIGARGKQLTRKSINGVYNVQVTFPIRDRILALEERRQGLAELQVGAKSIHSFLEDDRRVPNVHREEQLIMKDQFNQREWVQDLYHREFAEQEGVVEEFDAQQEQMQMQMGGMGGGNMPVAGADLSALDGRQQAAAALMGGRAGLTNDTPKIPQNRGASAVVGDTR